MTGIKSKKTNMKHFNRKEMALRARLNRAGPKAVFGQTQWTKTIHLKQKSAGSVGESSPTTTIHLYTSVSQRQQYRTAVRKKKKINVKGMVLVLK